MTGALVLSRETSGDSAVAYFDPHRHDHELVDEENDGTVLGLAAVFIAQISKALDDVCLKRKGAPHYQDLKDAILEGVRKAVPQCQRFLFDGYGDSIDRLVNERTAFTGLPLVDPNSEPADKSEFQTQVHQVSRTSVPAVVPTGWSILNQSVQYDVLKIAEEVAFRGVNHAFNRPFYQHNEICEDLAKGLAHDLLQYHISTPSSDRKIGSYREPIWKCFPDASGQVESSKASDFWNAMPQAVREWVCGDLLTDVPRTVDTLVQEAGEFFQTNKSNQDPLTNVNALLWQDSLWQQLKKALSENLRDPANASDEFELYAAPIVRFGGKSSGKDLGKNDLIVMDRREVEEFSAVKTLMANYLRKLNPNTSERPLSVAVFGPPGSGKSFAVKRMAEQLFGETEQKYKIIEVNLSQLNSSDQLEGEFQKIVAARADQQVPLVFFDEFDSHLSKERFGWLKHFLSAMEDGNYRGKNANNAVFVFAGGTCSTFQDFSMMNRSQSSEEYVEFSNAKGPDFVSRLSGHLNITGVNPKDEQDSFYPLRRAILVRSFLEAKQRLTDRKPAEIDRALLRAILRVPYFRHGNRSIRMLLDACSDRQGRVLRSLIPPLGQLNMIVDAKSFIDELQQASSLP